MISSDDASDVWEGRDSSTDLERHQASAIKEPACLPSTEVCQCTRSPHTHMRITIVFQGNKELEHHAFLKRREVGESCAVKSAPWRETKIFFF